MNEKGQILAPHRSQPRLPMKEGRGATMTCNYKRNGTSPLFADLRPAIGEFYWLFRHRHYYQEWPRFLPVID